MVVMKKLFNNYIGGLIFLVLVIIDILKYFFNNSIYRELFALVNYIIYIPLLVLGSLISIFYILKILKRKTIKKSIFLISLLPLMYFLYKCIKVYFLI